MSVPSVPATLASDDHTLEVVEALLAWHVGQRVSIHAQTTLDIRTLDHPAAVALHRLERDLTATGADLWRGTTGGAAASASGLTAWLRQVRSAWRQLLLDLPETVALGLAAAPPALPSRVVGLFDSATDAPSGMLAHRRHWRPRSLPSGGELDGFLRTLPEGSLRETADHTTRVRQGTASVLRQSCVEVLSHAPAVRDQARSIPGPSLVLLQVLLEAGGTLPLAQVPLMLGTPLQDSARDNGSPLAWLQRAGLAYVGVGARSEVLEVVVPDPIRAALARYAPEADPKRPGLELDVRITGLHPPVWRRIRLRGHASLAELHFAIQGAFGWRNAHLFEFQRTGRAATLVAGVPMGETDPHEPPDAWSVPMHTELSRVGDRLQYVYDFGDDWVHDVEVVGVLPRPLRRRRELVDGERAAPLEDSGGPEGYEDCVAVAMGVRVDPELTTRVGDWDPEAFDLAARRRSFDA